jgi:hypothetical protein
MEPRPVEAPADAEPEEDLYFAEWMEWTKGDYSDLYPS